MSGHRSNWAPKPNLSKTSMAVYDACRRRYALQYYTRFFPPELRREAEFHAKLMGFSALAGQVVDDVITSDLRQLGAEGFCHAEDYLRKAKEITGEYVHLSNVWRRLYQANEPPERNPRRQPLDRLFFGGEISRPDRDAFFAHVSACLGNFYRSNLAAEIAAKPAHWRVVPQAEEPPPWFLMGEVPVYAKYDFMLMEPERTVIYDWKTGEATARTEAAAREQLTIYAIYAHRRLGVPYEKIELASVWLGVGPDQMDSFRPNLEVVAALEQEWQTRYAELRAQHIDVESGASPLDLFPMTGFPKACRWCNFRACEGYVKMVALREEAAAGDLGRNQENSDESEI